MRLRVPRSSGVWLLLALAGSWLALAPSAALAQVSRSPEPVFIAPELPPETSLASVIAEGARLESLHRWGEALTHYEEALRNHPDSDVLQKREDLAKIHFSLDRRYADHSFVQSLQSLTPQQATGLYLELARKINTHYVVTPPWQKLASRGAAALDLALADPAFCSANRLNVAADRLSSARRELYQLIGSRQIGGPDDLAALGGEAARLMESRRGLRQSATFTRRSRATSSAWALN